MSDGHNGFIHKLDKSAFLTVAGILLLFASAIVVTLVAPQYVDDSWESPSSDYQVQMYEVVDPNVYISTSVTGGENLKTVFHLKEGYTLMAFAESEFVRFIAPKKLRSYITRYGEEELKLTSNLLLLREPKKSEKFDGVEEAEVFRKKLQLEWMMKNSDWKREGLQMPRYEILELYETDKSEVFSVVDIDPIVQDWVDEKYTIVDEKTPAVYQNATGVVYVNNPQEYRIKPVQFGNFKGWQYDPQGEPVASLEELKSDKLGFLSREELIAMGENIFVIDGCWYCHTDQTRTLIQDTVLNGSENYPAPPSSANEYIYQKVSFLGTRRIGPDISRVGIKRPNRDWHKAHFWSPKTQSSGSIMPAFQYFFDDDPRGTAHNPYGVPNYRFEAIFQYLMTKGTRITAPTKSWWTGRDPVETKKLIEGRRG